MVFRFRAKERLAATHALVSTCGLSVFVFAGEGRLSSLLSGHIVLILRELLAPGGVVFAHFVGHGSPLLGASLGRFSPYKIQKASFELQNLAEGAGGHFWLTDGSEFLSLFFHDSEAPHARASS